MQKSKLFNGNYNISTEIVLRVESFFLTFRNNLDHAKLTLIKLK